MSQCLRTKEEFNKQIIEVQSKVPFPSNMLVTMVLLTFGQWLFEEGLSPSIAIPDHRDIGSESIIEAD